MIGALTNHLWQSTIFAFAAGLLTIAFRGNRAHVRYWLWLSASIKFFLPFSLLMTLGSRLDWAPAAQQMAAPVFSSTMMQISEPFAGAQPSRAPSKVSTSGSPDWLSLSVFGVWLCGFAAIVLMRLQAWRRIRAAVRASAPWEGGGVEMPKLPVRSTPGLLEPGVVGVWRLLLLVPAGIEDHLTPRQLEAVLAHEACHVRRRDNLTATIHMIVEGLFWFHPLVWWIGARLVDERERACDEDVLRVLGEPQAYAEGILNVCKRYVETPLACVSGVGGSNITKRIEAIMANRIGLRLTLARKGVLTAAAIAAFAIPLVIGAMNTPVLARSQVTNGPPFEAASIKPCPAGSIGGRTSFSPGRMTLFCHSVLDLIQLAYLLDHPLRPGAILTPVEGGSTWIKSQGYTINAVAAGAANSGTMHGPMLRTLLADRFNLQIHAETRQVPVYRLTASDGRKLQPFKDGSCTPIDFTRDRGDQPPLVPGATRCRTGVSKKAGPTLMLEAQGVSLEVFSTLLRLDRRIIDRTGMAGRFDFHLEYANPTLAGGPAASLDAPTAPSIFTALQQIGLKLEPDRGPGEFLVVDRVERPTED